MGDFLGFTFGNVHSSDLGITRVSGGDRYDEELHPEIKDRTAEVPGLNGEYYFGSDFGSRSFDIEIAFDSVTELQFRRLRQIFGTKTIQPLIFDERPYKKYMVKLESPIELSYVCFDEPMKVDTTIEGIRYKTDEGYDNSHIVKRSNGINQRIYKGEGKMTFVAYFPFAKSVFKQLSFSFQKTTDIEWQENKQYYIFDRAQGYILVTNQMSPQPNIEDCYEKVNREGVDDWAISSGILSANDYEVNKIDKFENDQIVVYNPGDVATGFRLYFPPAAAEHEISIVYEINNETVAELNLKPITLKPCATQIVNNREELVYDAGFMVDTNNGLVVGVKPQSIQGGTQAITYDQDMNAVYYTSGNLYNEYISSGYLFHIEPSKPELSNSYERGVLSITGGVEGIQIFYDYLYF